MKEPKLFPEDMIPLEDTRFKFSCHPGVACFTVCCKNVDMILYPYDIIRLKHSINEDSAAFLRKYTRLVQGDNPLFPTVMLSLSKSRNNSCPFLSESGCTVYKDRPTACRTYPLERAVDRKPEKGSIREYFFSTHHSYCLGHNEEKFNTVREWIRDQRLDDYNMLNELWTEIDTVFAGNPWHGEGHGGPRQQLAFMVCYDIDGFRRLANEKKLIEQFAIPKDTRRRIANEDTELLKFGFEWLKLLFTEKSSLVKK